MCNCFPATTTAFELTIGHLNECISRCLSLLQLAEDGWESNPDFRERVVFKITNIGSRRVANNERRKVRLGEAAGLRLPQGSAGKRRARLAPASRPASTEGRGLRPLGVSVAAAQGRPGAGGAAADEAPGASGGQDGRGGGGAGKAPESGEAPIGALARGWAEPWTALCPAPELLSWCARLLAPDAC